MMDDKPFDQTVLDVVFMDKLNSEDLNVSSSTFVKGKDNCFYGFGGISRTGRLSSKFWELTYCDEAKVRSVKTYSSAEPEARYAHTGVYVNSKFFIFGGRGQESVLNDIWRFSFEHNTWRYMGEIDKNIRGLWGHTATLLDDNHILLFGGIVNETRDEFSSKYYIYNIEQDTVKPFKVLEEFFRESHTANLLNDKIWIAGGVDTSLETQSGILDIEVEEHGLKNFTLSNIKDLKLQGHQSVQIDNMLVVVGGDESNDSLQVNRAPKNTVLAIDIESERTIELGQLDTVKSFFNLAKITDNEMLMFGGLQTGSNLFHVLKFNVGQIQDQFMNLAPPPSKGWGQMFFNIISLGYYC